MSPIGEMLGELARRNPGQNPRRAAEMYVGTCYEDFDGVDGQRDSYYFLPHCT